VASIEDVRRALWAAYETLYTVSGEICGKSDEAVCHVIYPSWWEWEGEKGLNFFEPIGLMVYSYALGPSREHYFWRGVGDYQSNYYTWHSPDPFQKAVEVIGEWVKETLNNEDSFNGEQV